MRTRPLPLTWAGVLSLSLLGGCGDKPEARTVRKEASDVWQAAKAWGYAQRAEAERVYVESVDRLATTYEAAKAEAQAKGGDARESLEAKWAELTRRLAEVKSASADTWERTRVSFVAAYEAFQREMARP
jgi:hypothetical protein